MPGTNDSVTSELTSWSAIVLPDEFLSDGKLLYFTAFFVSDTPVYLQIWRPGNASMTIAHHIKVFPRTLNVVETVSGDGNYGSFRPAITYLPTDLLTTTTTSTIQTFDGRFSGTTQVTWYQKGKTNLDLLKQETVSAVRTSLRTGNHASTPPLSFLQAGCPSRRPTNNVKVLKALTHSLTYLLNASATMTMSSCAGSSVHFF